MIHPIKRVQIWENWINLRRFLAHLQVNPVHLLIPALLAMIASLFEAATIGLLIPTIKGIIQADYNFVRDIPIFEKVIDLFPHTLEKRNSPIFILLVISIFCASTFKNTFQYFSYLCTVLQVRRFANNLRKGIYEKYLSFNKLFFDRHNMGHLHQLLVGHTSQIATQMSRIQNTFYSIFTLFVYLFLMILISWKLTLFILLSFPILHLSLQWLIRKISKTSEYFSDTYLKLGSKISNALSCIPLIKAYTHEAKEKDLFEQSSDRIESLEVSIDKKLLLIGPVQEMILLCMVLLLVGMMALLFVREGHREIAGYMVFVVILRRSMISLGVYNEIQGALATIRGPIKEVMKVFDQNEEYVLIDGQKEFLGLKRGIEFQSVCFSYQKGHQILNDVSLLIQKGKMTAIVGATGAGKTTLINLIIRFYDISSGRILFDETEIHDFSLASLRSKIAWVGQEMFLFNASLRTNLIYGLSDDLPEESIVDALRKARLYDFVSNLPQGLEAVIGDRGVKLSTGEKQRVAIARAFLKNSEILILDEATSSLDSKTEELIQDALKEVVQNRTSIVIAHRLSTVRHADKIVVIEHGRIVEEGNLNELLNRKGKFYHYWEKQHFFK